MKKNPSPYIKTKIELATKLSVSRVYLDDLLTRQGAPRKAKRGWKLSEVLEFVKSQATSEQSLAKRDDGFRQLKQREIRLRCEKIENENALFRGEYLKRTEVEQSIAALASETISEFRRQFGKELPPQLFGLKSAAEIQNVLERNLNEVLTRLHSKAGQIGNDNR